MSAFEELQNWCAKYLGALDYKVVPESPSYLATIYFIDNGVTYICFDSAGAVSGMGTLDDDEWVDHIEDYERAEERQEKKEPPSYSLPPQSLGGQMVRTMIEAYERQAH